MFGRSRRQEIGNRADNHMKWGTKDAEDQVKKTARLAREKRIEEEKAARERAAAAKLARDRRTIEERARAKRAGETTRQSNRWW